MNGRKTVTSAIVVPDIAAFMRATILNQPQPLEAGMAVLADDDVIVHRNAERLCHRDDLLRHLDVGMRWFVGSPDG